MQNNNNTNPSAIRVIYIMGRGHSGSTVFDAILGNSPEIESVGELVSAIAKPERQCSCGLPLKDCSYWTKVKDKFEESSLEWTKEVTQIVNQAHLKKLFSTVTSKSSSAWIESLVKVQDLLFSAILSSSGKNIIVDSSKEFTRAIFLLRFFPNAKVIHLVRNPEGTLASDMHRIVGKVGITILRKKIKSKNITPLLMIFRAISWSVGNMIAEITRLFFPSRVIRLRYEDLTMHTEESLKRVAEFIDVDLTTVINSVISQEKMAIGHNIGGNHMRLKKEFIFDPQAGGKRPLAKRYRLLARFFCWPLMLVYGYNPIKPLNSKL